MRVPFEASANDLERREERNSGYLDDLRKELIIIGESVKIHKKQVEERQRAHPIKTFFSKAFTGLSAFIAGSGLTYSVFAQNTSNPEQAKAGLVVAGLAALLCFTRMLRPAREYRAIERQVRADPQKYIPETMCKF